MKGATQSENVIVFPLSGEYKITKDGPVYFEVLERLFKEVKK
jgi:hypothetical protein